MDELRALILYNGRTVVDVTPAMTTGNWSSAAVGGYASCELTLPGIKVEQVPYLALLRLTRGPEVLFEGEIEDRTLTIEDGAASTAVQAFGLRRRLADTSIRRIWVKRDFQWQTILTLTGTPSCATNAVVRDSQIVEIRTGNIDETDLTRIGVSFNGNGTGTGKTGHAMAVYVPLGVGCTSILYDQRRATASEVAFVRESADGITWTEVVCGKGATGGSSYSQPLLPTSRYLMLGSSWDTSATSNTAQLTTFENIRILGTQTTEDATGGLYGGTILDDVLAQVAGLTPGIVEAGSDFTITALDRQTRDTAESVVNEVAGYYTREWAVWQDGVFDWKTVNLDEAQYQLTIADCRSITIEGTLEDTPETVIVQYQDTTGLASEATAASSDQRNPFVKQGRTKDMVVQVGFPMTNITAAQLAARVAADHGSYPTANGRVVLAFSKTVARANGSPAPAYTIRGGENVTIRDLPKTDAFQTGRDGETHFHVASVAVDMDAQTVTLELEGQIRRSDVLLARLAAATKTLTG